MRSPVLIILLAFASVLCNAADRPPLWLYYSVNLAVGENIDTLENVFRRAAEAGYSHVLLTDTKFGRIGELPATYTTNVERVKKIAADLDLELVPALFPIGYSESLLYHNPNLAEGLPVRDALYEVRNGIANLVPEPAVQLASANFQSLDGWSMHDAGITVADGAAKVVDPNGNARLMQPVKVAPFRQYHVSVEIKTADFQGTPEIKILDGAGHPLNYDTLEVARTQDWRRYNIVFNSLDNSAVRVYFGCWNGTKGTLWWRSPNLQETGLVNLLRRTGTPLNIRIDGEAADLLEGKDYEQVSDPRMGKVPWSGSFEPWHSPPQIRIDSPDGTRLRVSYYHAVLIHKGQVMICPSEAETVALLKTQATRLHDLFQAKGYFMSHDEIRALNWCKACQDRRLEAGEILAENVRTCVQILREINPGGDIYVWSDMFDPHHNARKDYYLVRGDLGNSWKGLDKDIIIAVWNYESRQESIEWFTGLGNRLLIAGYYDSKPLNIRNWLSAVPPESRVAGIMYTTWESNYRDLEAFAKVARQP